MSEKQKFELLGDISSKEFNKPPILPKNFEFLANNKCEIADNVFNAILPSYYRAVAAIHWTPVQIAKQIAELLIDCDPKSKFLDIGSGCGKLCVVLSYLSNIKFHGIEQRKDLFDIANRISLENQRQNVSFQLGNFLELDDWDEYDIIYLFNPFQEHITDIDGMRIDANINFSRRYFTQYINAVFWQLCSAKAGLKLITYHGYGGRIPHSWKLAKSQIRDGSDLSLWEKVT